MNESGVKALSEVKAEIITSEFLTIGNSKGDTQAEDKWSQMQVLRYKNRITKREMNKQVNVNEHWLNAMLIIIFSGA